MIKKIAFFYPVKYIGGAQLLFARLAAFFLLQKKEVVIIDYADGFILEYLKERNLNPTFIKYEDGKKTNISENICLVLPLSSFFYNHP